MFPRACAVSLIPTLQRYDFVSTWQFCEQSKLLLLTSFNIIFPLSRSLWEHGVPPAAYNPSLQLPHNCCLTTKTRCVIISVKCFYISYFLRKMTPSMQYTQFSDRWQMTVSFFTRDVCMRLYLDLGVMLYIFIYIIYYIYKYI